MKDKIRNFLYKIKFKQLTIIIFILLIINVLLLLTNHGLAGATLIIFIGIYSLLLFILYTLKLIIDDIKSILIGIGIIAWFILLIYVAGLLMIKFIPKLYAGNENEMYNLFTTAFTSVIAAAIGILGTIYGAIYGGRKSLESVEKQFKKQEEDINRKNNENREITIRIITKFLKEEIIDNNIEIEKSSIYNRINNGYGTQYGYRGKELLKFDSYEKIKYELIKYMDLKIVEDVVDLYELFHLLARYDDLNKLNKKEFNKIIGLKNKIDNLLKLIEK